MADYQATATDAVIRTADGAVIPNDPGNRDWIEYQNWLALGNEPDPYVPPGPEPPQTDTVQDVVLFDHENRLRSLEGEPPLSIDEFRAKMTGG